MGNWTSRRVEQEGAGAEAGGGGGLLWEWEVEEQAVIGVGAEGRGPIHFACDVSAICRTQHK